MTDNDADEGHDNSGPAIRYVNLYESEEKVYIRKVSGLYQSLRRYINVPLLLIFLLMPWLIIDDRPAVLFDIANRQFHILWLTFGPRDSLLLAGLLIISAFLLFTVTAFSGRVWCGFTCPQTVWTLMFIRVESFCEGDRNKRIKLDNSPWTIEKICRKTAKYGLWLMISLVTGITFVAYFYPIRELLTDFLPYINETGVWVFSHIYAMLWILFFTGITYMNAGFLREQVCKYMCPYARFQSVMYDSDTLAVHYDAARGEARGARKADEDHRSAGQGDCIDCSWCVQVCPVDIDIRDGLQYECINCGLCVDACDTVMDKMGYAPGLIRFTSDNELKTGIRQIMRPRIVAYLLILIILLAAFFYTVVSRQPVMLDISRDRGAQLFRVRNGSVDNVYTVKIHNMDRSAHQYRIELDTDLPFTVKYRPVFLEEGEIFSIPLRVSIAQAQLTTVTSEIRFIVRAVDDDNIMAQESATFIGPAAADSTLD